MFNYYNVANTNYIDRISPVSTVKKVGDKEKETSNRRKKEQPSNIKTKEKVNEKVQELNYKHIDSYV